MPGRKLLIQQPQKTKGRRLLVPQEPKKAPLKLLVPQPTPRKDTSPVKPKREEKPKKEFDRIMFSTSRAADFFTLKNLQIHTGQSDHMFPIVALKELVDNALDACETAKVTPEITIKVQRLLPITHIEVSDNANGLPHDVVKRILDFNTRTSDKSAYKTPTRGAQGNALKTVLGMPCAFGIDDPVTITTGGREYLIGAKTNPAGDVIFGSDPHTFKVVAPTEGTSIRVTVKESKEYSDSLYDYKGWAMKYALFNPHAFIKFEEIDHRSKLAYCEEHQPSILWPGGTWDKYMPYQKASPHWYDINSFKTLIWNYISFADHGGRDLPLREFIVSFRGITSVMKSKHITDQFSNLQYLTDFRDADVSKYKALLEALKESTIPVKAKYLGCVGTDHFYNFIDHHYGIREYVIDDISTGPRYWYSKKSAEQEDDSPPDIVEAVGAEIEEEMEEGPIFTGINFSPTYEDPTEATYIEATDNSVDGGYGIKQFLNDRDVRCSGYRKSRRTTVNILHIITIPEYKDPGKSTLKIED